MTGVQTCALPIVMMTSGKSTGVQAFKTAVCWIPGEVDRGRISRGVLDYFPPLTLYHERMTSGTHGSVCWLYDRLLEGVAFFDEACYNETLLCLMSEFSGVKCL